MLLFYLKNLNMISNTQKSCKNSTKKNQNDLHSDSSTVNILWHLHYCFSPSFLRSPESFKHTWLITFFFQKKICLKRMLFLPPLAMFLLKFLFQALSPGKSWYGGGRFPGGAGWRSPSDWRSPLLSGAHIWRTLSPGGQWLCFLTYRFPPQLTF